MPEVKLRRLTKKALLGKRVKVRHKDKEDIDHGIVIKVCADHDMQSVEIFNLKTFEIDHIQSPWQIAEVEDLHGVY